MKNRIANIAAVCLLSIVFLLCLLSIKDDSLTMDELAHLPSGYSYLTQKDMRLNQEHPPLIKDLSALPLLLIKDINFPSEIDAWKNDINGQWIFGNQFLFNANNQADKMIFWGRVPMILVLLALGFYVFKWTREKYGNKSALLALFLFSFSPTLLAHGRLVTTDVGASLGMFVALYYFLKALKDPNKKNIVLSGLAFGLAQLLKFSSIMIAPLFVFLAFLWWIQKSGTFQQALKVLVFTFVLGALLIYPVYQFHVLDYPVENQARDIEATLDAPPVGFLSPVLSGMAKIPVLRAYAQYLLGLAMVFRRATGGNTTFFLGEVSSSGWKNYFPIVYLIKEPITFHFLSALSLLCACLYIKQPFWKKPIQRINKWIKSHFAEFAIFSFLGLYWLSTLTSNLNIGVRHLLPTFPFVMLLIAGMTKEILKPPYLKIKYGILGLLLLWQIISVVSVFPYFLTYFNEIIGGPDNGSIYTVDSNLDWGQDLKRLKQWTDDNEIEKIYIDYFGGTDVKYYFHEQFEPWWGTRPLFTMQRPGYLAVSETFLEGGRGKAVEGFKGETGHYRWLNNYVPVANIGHSIIVYYIN